VQLSTPDAPRLNITRETLKQRYSDLVDDELLRRLRSGVLTELAREVALEEIATRGLSPDAPLTDTSPAINPELEFAEDEFERNPYQAPRLTPHASTQPAAPYRRRIADLLWFAYVAITTLLILAMIVDPLRERDFGDAFHPGLAFTGMAMVGLVAWRLRKALLSPLLWIGCFAANLAMAAVGWKAYLALISADSSGQADAHLPVVAAGLVLLLPMYWGLARYAFGSRSIWDRRVARHRGSARDTDI
jgi:hypothetical protein